MLLSNVLFLSKPSSDATEFNCNIVYDYNVITKIFPQLIVLRNEKICVTQVVNDEK